MEKADMGKKVFENAAARVPIKLLDAVIVIGISVMAILIPLLSLNGSFTIRFESNGGSYVEPQYLKFGDRIECPEVPEREGYVFCGWFYDVEGNRVFDFDSAEANSSITLFAKWEMEVAAMCGVGDAYLAVWTGEDLFC